MKVAIVVSQFNQVITDKLLTGAEQGLREQGVEFEVYRVPGAFEIPLMIQAIALGRKEIDGVIALGVLIDGETDHYKAICRGVVDGLSRVMLDHTLPIAFEVLMVKESRLAYARADDQREKNKGYSAAYALTSMIEQIKGL